MFTILLTYIYIYIHYEKKENERYQYHDDLVSYLVQQLKDINLEDAQNEWRRNKRTRDLWSNTRMVHGKEPYYKKIYRSVNYLMNVYFKKNNHDADARRGDDGAVEAMKKNLGEDDKINADHSTMENTDIIDGSAAISTDTSPSFQITNKDGDSKIDRSIFNSDEDDQQKRRKIQSIPICRRSKNLPSLRQLGLNIADDDDAKDVISATPFLESDIENDYINGPLTANRRSRNTMSIATNSNMKKQLQLNIHGFMELPTSDPTKCLSMCMHCRLVPIRLRFPDSFCVGPMSLCRIQKHRQMCHTSGLDLTATADALDEIIRSDFGNDLNVLQLNSFVEVIRAAVVHETLVTIFTQNLVRLIHTRRGLLCDDDAYDTDPNVVPPNVWQLFPTTVDFNTVEKALQLFVNEVGNIPVNKDNPNFLHFLLMISPGLHAPKKLA